MEELQALAPRILEDLLRVGGEDFVRELFGGLDDLAPELIKKAADCAAAGDGTGVHAHVHNLKGAAANLGAERLARAAERTLAAVAENANASAALEELGRRWAELRAELLARGYIGNP